MQLDLSPKVAGAESPKSQSLAVCTGEEVKESWMNHGQRGVVILEGAVKCVQIVANQHHSEVLSTMQIVWGFYSNRSSLYTLHLAAP